MRKKSIVCFLAGMLMFSSVLTGCGQKASPEMEKYKTQGISMMAQGDYASALENFQKALDQSVGMIGPEETDLCYYKAMAQYRSKDAEGALATCTALIEYDKKNWEIYYLRGSIYLSEGQQQEALKDFDQAVSMNKSIMLCTNIYKTLCNANVQALGQKYYDQAMSRKPSGGEDDYYLGELFYLTQDYEQAETKLEAARSEGYSRASLLLGQMYMEQEKQEEAHAAFDAYLAENPEDGEALNLLGEISMSGGNYTQAVSYFKSAIVSADEEAAASYRKNLIAAYEYAGSFEKALEEAKSYLRTYQDADVQKEYEFLKTRVVQKTAVSSDGVDEIQGAIPTN